jgi:hypothetical protein
MESRANYLGRTHQPQKIQIFLLALSLYTPGLVTGSLAWASASCQGGCHRSCGLVTLS